MTAAGEKRGDIFLEEDEGDDGQHDQSHPPVFEVKSDVDLPRSRMPSSLAATDALPRTNLAGMRTDSSMNSVVDGRDGGCDVNGIHPAAARGESVGQFPTKNSSREISLKSF